MDIPSWREEKDKYLEGKRMSGVCDIERHVPAGYPGFSRQGGDEAIEVGDGEYTELNFPLFCEAPRLDGLRH